jgi:hypothetical protein
MRTELRQLRAKSLRCQKRHRADLTKGGHAWTARGLWALARMYRVTETNNIASSTRHARSLGFRTAKFERCRYRRGGTPPGIPSDELRDKILAHCNCILALGPGPYFHDQPNTLHLDLWGYHQLHAMARAAKLLDRSDLYDRAARRLSTS